MKSNIAQAVEMRYLPVAVIHTNEKPEGAMQFKEGSTGCVVGMLNAAARGKTVVFDRKTYGCPGAAVGLGFTDVLRFPGGAEYFLSTGNKEFCKTELGKKIAEKLPDLENGERCKKNPEIAKKFIETLPLRDVPTEYIVFKPLEEVEDKEIPEVVVFMVTPDQLTGLVVLAEYERGTRGNVTIGFSSACEQIGIIPYKEREEQLPKATIGLVDVAVRRRVDKDILSFSVPYKMFLEMESNVKGSFLETSEWSKVNERNRQVTQVVI